MKIRLSSVIAFLLLSVSFINLSCEEEPEPINYTSLVGKWTFSNANVSGDFEIADFSGTLAIEDGGTFSFGGNQYTTIKSNIIISGFNLSFGLRGASAAGCAGCYPYISFNESSSAGEYSSDYTQMTFKAYRTVNSYLNGGNVISDFERYTETVSITRK